ncbi:MAG: hypothetical protein WA191_23340 [Telluria sp.]
MGDESIMRPPAAKKWRMTSVQLARAAGSSPTLKVIRLPRPMSGSAWPEDGIGRLSNGLAGGAPAALGAAERQHRLEKLAPAHGWRRLHTVILIERQGHLSSDFSIDRPGV